ncbi:hypothetical protein HPB52_007476 [Rhipicephalus sanguineus]|uniref:Uncharacterized protein n=1 Tax=Rhipicephalus sanguineus TaxID=34632 RepID=A0A9D4PMF7_RHISA|nr:hypothetical protein HPB52_007476 [Rhipicephalus sanguineus]
MLSKNKRGLAIPTRNRTSRGGKAGATSKDVTIVSNHFHGLTSKASSSIETRGPSVTTRSPRGDVAADASVLPIDLRPDNGSDSEDVVVILGSDRRPTIGTSTVEVTAVDFINWTTSRELSTFVALEDVDPNVVQNTATGAFRDETARTFDREENSLWYRYVG